MSAALRPIVLRFAKMMEEEMRLNDHKKGWQHMSPDDCLQRLFQELGELLIARKRGLHNLKSEAADVANFLMFYVYAVEREWETES